MILAAVILTMLAGLVVLAQTSGKQHVNPMVDLLQQHKPVFGIYLPSAFNLPGAAPRGQGNRGEGGRGRGQYKVADGYPPQEAPCDEATELVKNPPKVSPASPEDVKQQNEIAKLAMSHHEQDYLFSGSFEGGVEKPLPVFTELMKGLSANGMVGKSPAPRMMPVMLKAPKVGCDPKKAVDNISKELNIGAAGLMFPHTASAKDLQAGLAAMRFKSKGGTRPDDVGIAPSVWGMTPQQYKDKADLSSMNPNGDLVNFTIVEDKDGLAHVREIAAVKGIGVLWPGAGTLGGVFWKDDGNGNWVRDDEAWEKAIQQVLAACKEFNVPCGYPANSWDDARGGMDKRMKQGFTVFVSGWGDAGSKTITQGRQASGRPESSNNQ
jgi:2-keto-3-deoxy-L-rhamnonate aldolase RhmA